MLSVVEARDKLLEQVDQLPVETVGLANASGRVLAADVMAPHPLPPFAASSMDGYAVRSEDLKQATEQAPVELAVIGEAAAGHMEAPAVGKGQAVRITTGAPVPAGADSVLPVEDTDQPGPMVGQSLPAHIRTGRSLQPGEFIRPSGLDVQSGQRVLSAGRRLRPQDIGLLAALGQHQLQAFRQPRVALLSSGDEVIEPTQDIGPGQIRDANGYMLAAALETAGADPVRLGIAADDRQAVLRLLDDALDRSADLILSTAGVSMGAHDYIREVLQEKGELAFWRVNIRPGKPLAFGRYRGLPLIGLPGNPVSAWVTFTVFVRPLLAHMQGGIQASPLRLQAALEQALQSDGRESYLRAAVRRIDGGFRVRLTGSQDSSVRSALVAANGLVRIPAGVTSIAAGDLVEVWVIDPFPFDLEG